MRNLTYTALLALIGWSMPATAAPSPAALYQKHCAACHEGGVPRAPHSVKFQMIGTRAILASMEAGVMQAQGAALSANERRELAEFLGGATRSMPPPRCRGAPPRERPSTPPVRRPWRVGG